MCCSILNNLLHSLWTILIPSDILLARKVDLKLDYIGRSTMHVKMEEAPEALARRNVVSIEVLFNFIIASAKLHCDVIMAFVDILENVLDSLDRGNRLDVNMAAVLPDEIGTVSEDPTIVDLLSSDLMCASSVPVFVGCIGILRDGCLIPEWLWKVLGALSILHARCISVVSATGVMNHEHFDQLQQLWCAELGFLIEKDNAVHVREATFLKLYGEEVSHHLSKYASPNVLQHLGDLLQSDLARGHPESLARQDLQSW